VKEDSGKTKANVLELLKNLGVESKGIKKTKNKTSSTPKGGI
jgi:hypothetical protein